MRYRISKYLISNGNSCLQKTTTGQLFEISQETLKLLSFFKKPKSILEVLNTTKTKKRDRQKLAKFISGLIKEGLLVKNPEKEIDIGKSIFKMTNNALVQSTKKTFLASNAGSFKDINSGDIVFIGVPFDLGSTGYPGARFAPDKMRELSFDSYEYHADIFDRTTKGWLSLEHDRYILSNKRIIDIGNIIHQIGEGFDTFFNRLEKAIEKILVKKAFPVIIGGDHSISYGSIKAFKRKNKNLGVIHIDAHTDLADLIPGVPNNHGNVFSRLLKGHLIKHLYQFGVRGMIGKKLEARNYSQFSLPFLKQKNNLLTAVNQLNPNLIYYLSLDIDVLDPVFAPGTGTSMPQGMTTEFLFELLSFLAAKVSIIGFDLVEVNPMLDIHHRTSDLANSLIVHLLSEIKR